MATKKPGKGRTVRGKTPKSPRKPAKTPSAKKKTASTPSTKKKTARSAVRAAAPKRPAKARTGARSGTEVRAGRFRPDEFGPVVVMPDRPWLRPDPNENFFDANRPGHAVVRATDLVALRIELDNLVVEPGAPPRLKKSASGAAHLTLHFPPQAITEQTFFEARPPQLQNPHDKPGVPAKPEPPNGGSETPSGPPVRARISGESRLVFAVPDGFDVPYTLEGVLAAVEELALAVAPNALPPGVGSRWPSITDLFTEHVQRLSASQRAALSSYAVRSLRIGALQGDMTTLALRQEIGGPGLRRFGPDIAVIDVIRDRPEVRPVAGPRPAPPDAKHTAIELPWRLILRPHAGERWRHAKTPVTSAATQRTELWHSRLVAPQADGPLIEPPRPDAQRTVRAIWALTGEGSTQAMAGEFPATLPPPSTVPFRMPLDDFDRFQFVHLSANFSSRRYRPEAVDTHLLMLSALGGWLDSRRAWEPPAGLSVEEWVHRATMARDHFVRVVYKGFLFPFGHRVALVKVSERKFHNGAGNTAYLRQRLFLIVRERERRFADPTLTSANAERLFQRQMPFTSVRILTSVTPNLDQPDLAPSTVLGQQLFFPHVNGQPYRFACAATDIDGRGVQFELPMLFMDNTLANPGPLNTAPNYPKAEDNALLARSAWMAPARAGLRVAQLKLQRVALAASAKAGDTTVQVEELTFDAEVEKGNAQLRSYSNRLSRPLFYPKVSEARVRIAALAQLTGSTRNNRIEWNAHYLKNGFEANNQGQVFVDVTAEAGMAQLDFSTQGDRAGGFVQPNLKPSALSRLTGPVTGNVNDFVAGISKGADAFPATLSDLPLPLLFGCIPLGEVIEAVTGLAGKPEQVPKFVSEACSKLEDFVNGLARLFDVVSKLADQPGRAAEAAIEALVQSVLKDLLAQAQAYAAPLVANVKARIGELTTKLNALATQLQTLKDTVIDSAPALPGLPNAITDVQSAVANLRNAANAQVGGVSLPAGFRQSVLQVAQQVEDLATDFATLTTLLTQGKALYSALDAIVGQPEKIASLLGDPPQLKARLAAVQAAIEPLETTLKGFRLLAGAPREVVLTALAAVLQVLKAGEALADLLQLLTGEELTLRFDWNPTIANWALPGADPNKDPLFRVHDKRGFLVAVEAKVRKNGASSPRISAVCSLKHFDLVLIAPASFLELNFEKIEFRVDSGAKMDVDVQLTDIKFVGPLSFVETLRDLIPLDGFSDPPSLDITAKGIAASFSATLPNVSIGVFNLSNLSLGAGFTVPFIGQPLSVRFNFCTREQPFNLTVSLFGGGGFFGVTLDPHGVQILEAAFEFGASISIDFGVASGGVHVMAGIYFRMEKYACSLTGYFRLGGHVSVLGLISASLELYLALAYEFESGKCAGKAQLTIEVEVFMFSTSVTISCERKFAGANGDPSFRDLMGVNAALALSEELATIDDHTVYPWREYCEAFA